MAASVVSKWKTLLDTAYGEPGKRSVVSQKLLRAHAKATGFPDALERYHPAGRVSCASVLALCRPMMDCFCEPPEGGWLPFLYGYLANGLFHDPGRPPETRPQRQACWFYLTVLEMFLDRGNRPLRAGSPQRHSPAH